jgi:hypothetical protein
MAYFQKHPEVFPAGFEQGFHWHDQYRSSKQDVTIRRIKLKAGGVYQLVPSTLMPYLSGQTESVSKGLWLRQWAVPYEVIAGLFGRDACYWERMEASLGRLSLVGSLVKTAPVPQHLAADEKISYRNGQECYIGLIAGADCVLGAELSLSEDTEGLKQAYGVFKSECQSLNADYCPLSVNVDGWQATNRAWRELFEGVTLVLCFLHAYLKIRDMAKGLKDRFNVVSEELWAVYRQTDKALFRQQMSALLIWSKVHLADVERVRLKVEGLCSKVELFATAYDHPACYRTSNQIDRPMDCLDRYLYNMGYFKGHRSTANAKIRAWAMLYNFGPFCQRVQKRAECPKKSSRFEELNGFVYAGNWLENLLIAGSMNGFRRSHKKQ